MTILIANDDGIQARGLRFLIDRMRAVCPQADIYAVAPAGHCSGMSSALTMDRPLSLIPHPDYNGAHMFAVTGSPVDCVKLGTFAALPCQPDLMLSGVNHGSNSGNSNIYSGTMGAAMEACMLGVPAIGFSLLSHDPNADFSPTAPFVEQIIRQVIANGLPKDICLNVNMPKGITPKGIKMTACGAGRWTDTYDTYTDPHGRPFYWIRGDYEDFDPENPIGDNHWLSRGYITITPIRPDQTAFDFIEPLRSQFENI